MALDKNGKELPKGITLRADGRYMGRFKHNGESHTVYDKDLKAVKKKLADLKYEVEHGIFAKEADITVEAWFNTWMKEYKINSVKKGTIVVYQNSFTYNIKPFLGKKKLKDVRPEHIQRLYNDMVEKEYSNATIKLVNIVLNSMYKQAIKNRIVKENPVALATLPRNKEKSERRVLSLKEQQLFLQYAESSRYYNFYRIALFTGMRSGELQALQWNDIDFKNGTISVNGTLKCFNDKGFVKDSPKTSTSRRVIPMIDGVNRILKQHKLEQMKYKLFLGDKWKCDDNLNDLVFTNPTGSPISKYTILGDMSKIINDINKDVKAQAIKDKQEPVLFEHATPHALRHTFTTRGIENGIPPKVMQEILGHSTLAMTMDLYTHVLPDTKANEIKKIAYLL